MKSVELELLQRAAKEVREAAAYQKLAAGERLADAVADFAAVIESRVRELEHIVHACLPDASELR